MKIQQAVSLTAGRLGVRRWGRWHAPIAVAVVISASFVPLASSSSASALSSLQPEGLVCATGSTADFHHPLTAPLPSNPSFVLTAQDGYITTPDGNSIYMWGYSNGSGAYQDPGPVLCVNEGDAVTITLRNTLPVATSIQFPGMTGVLANGAPSQPQPASASLATPAGPDTGSAPNSSDATKETKVTYRFVADHPSSGPSWETPASPEPPVPELSAPRRHTSTTTPARPRECQRTRRAAPYQRADSRASQRSTPTRSTCTCSASLIRCCTRPRSPGPIKTGGYSHRTT